ncbi:MAG: CO dehydrogenase/acetyl-CoA synthase subunit delta [Candidatus Omnitrophota bacterium]
MAWELIKEKWADAIGVVEIGAGPAEGGTRAGTVRVGGETGLPYLKDEGEMPHHPAIAMEVFDTEPVDWPVSLKQAYGDALANPVDWAVKCEKEYRPDLLALRLAGTHPDTDNKSAEDAVGLVKDILSAVQLPLIILGCNDEEKDNIVLPKCAEAAKGQRCLIGDALQKNYKTLVAACMAYGHSIIAESPIDINIAKQLNILITEMGLARERIVINPTVGALGYGLEYAYSIMERARLSALGGDKMLAQPFVCFVGQEAWRAKEAKARAEEFPEWGDEFERGVLWEAITACSFLQSGADILVMRHPEAVNRTRENIKRLLG